MIVINLPVTDKRLGIDIGRYDYNQDLY